MEDADAMVLKVLLDEVLDPRRCGVPKHSASK